jgi:cell division septum initiation protein DivIVA
MEREIEFLRQQIEYLERTLETCMSRISALEAQAAELKRRPAFIVQETLEPAPRDFGSYEQVLVLDHATGDWVLQPRLRL